MIYNYYQMKLGERATGVAQAVYSAVAATPAAVMHASSSAVEVVSSTPHYAAETIDKLHKRWGWSKEAEEYKVAT